MATTSSRKRSTKTRSANKNKGTTVRKRKTTRKISPEVLKVAGVTLCAISIYIIVAMLSYVFTWQSDYDVAYLSANEIFQGEHDSKNLLGTYGAYLSYILVHRLFGLASLFIPIYIGFCGLDLWSQQHDYNLKEWGVNFLVLTIFSSIVLGFFFHDTVNPWAGVFGVGVNTWLFNTIGTVGTFILLTTVVVSLFVVYFNLSIDPVTNFFQELKNNITNFKFSGFSLPSLTIQSKSNGRKRKPRTAATKSDVRKRKTKKPSEVLEENARAYKVAALDIDEDDDQMEEEMVENEIDIEIGGSYMDEQLPIVKDKNFDPSADLEVEVVGTPKELTAPTSPRVDRLQVQENENELPIARGDYDPTLDLANYRFPSIEFLEPHGSDKRGLNKQELQENTKQIIETLKNFGIEITKISAKFGPTITLFELVPAPGVRISRIRNLEDDIALSLAALGIRIIAPIPGKGTIGIEVPNRTKETVSLRSIINTEAFQESNMELPIALGTSISMGNYIADLSRMPHLLMAGATGQGKSVGINAILISLLYAKHPSELKFVLIDPKKVELSIYNKIEKHFLAKLPSEEESIITDTSKSIHTLNALCIEMDNRYDLLKDAHVRNIREYMANF